MTAKTEPASRPSALRLALQLGLIIVLVIAGVVAFRIFFGPTARFQKLLDAEANALAAGEREAYLALQDQTDPEWWRQQEATFEFRLAARKRGEAWALEEPEQHQVVTAELEGTAAWAIWEHPVAGTTNQKIEFFRQIDGHWLHAGPDPEFWGAPRTLQGNHLHWVFRERDEEWVAATAGRAEDLFLQIRADLVLPAPSHALTVEVIYDAAGLNLVPYVKTCYVATPLLLGFDEAAMDRPLCSSLAASLAEEATGTSAMQLSTGQQTLWWSIINWEVERVMGVEQAREPSSALAEALAEGRVTGLQQLWPAGEARTAQRMEDMKLNAALSRELVDYIAERHGADRLVVLLYALPSAETPDALLKQVLGSGLDLAAFEADWLAFVRERHGGGE